MLGTGELFEGEADSRRPVHHDAGSPPREYSPHFDRRPLARWSLLPSSVSRVVAVGAPTHLYPDAILPSGIPRLEAGCSLTVDALIAAQRANGRATSGSGGGSLWAVCFEETTPFTIQVTFGEVRYHLVYRWAPQEYDRSRKDS
ncbi:hypothetical protein OH76DRAFT_718816 [Lentinus brumalis]|uniref:Uncharacterized protein n=1 Tax=Lentinus brumalis TaxID=2498619 RepID=A0A371D5L4_9APHY|nr:hypothetical protein OH76DRAFT_718816 [Polyporus brumalis]